MKSFFRGIKMSCLENMQNRANNKCNGCARFGNIMSCPLTFKRLNGGPNPFYEQYLWDNFHRGLIYDNMIQKWMSENEMRMRNRNGG